MRRSWKLIAVVAALALALTSSIALAASGGGSSSKGDRDSNGTRSRPAPPPHAGRDLSKLASELGVSTTELRKALDAVRDELGPPQRPRNGARPSKAQMEERCVKATDALADELGKTGTQVRGAVKQVMKDGLEQAVKNGRLTQSQADRMERRIDSAACVFGPHPGGPGHGRACGGKGGPAGPGGPGGRGHHGPPPGMAPGANPDAGTGAPQVQIGQA